MSEEQNTGRLQEDLGADAVCAQCGTVNAEGVFICKTCGNNLRDQRQLRMTAEQALERGDETDRRQILFGLLTVLGLLVILWTATNVETITNWLIDIQRPSVTGIEQIWEGPRAAVVDAMVNELYAFEPGRDAMTAAMENPLERAEIDGTYVVAIVNALGNKRPVGLAAVKSDLDMALFAARIFRSGEIRGQARRQGNSWLSDWNNARFFGDTETIAVSGVALRLSTGEFECFGQRQDSDTGYDFLAYPIEQ
jgi:hypothetical protein